MCGKISSDTEGNAKCSFTGHTPDDDRVQVDCGKLTTASIDGVSISPPKSSNGSETKTSQSEPSSSSQTKDRNANTSGSSAVNNSSSIAQDTIDSTTGNGNENATDSPAKVKPKGGKLRRNK
jgi:hypothetical protein